MKRPYIHVNVAMTADGKIDSALRRGAAISSSADKRRVDELRASVDAVLVGGRTLFDEDPGLIVKSADLRAERVRKGLPENPAKVGAVSEIPAVRPINGIRPGEDHAPLQTFLAIGPARRLIYTTIRTASEQIALLKNAGAEVFVQDGERVNLASMLASLHELSLRRLMVEGGGTLIAEFFRLGFVDELTIYIAPKIFGGASAPSLADGLGLSPEQANGLELVSVKKFDDEDGVLVHYKVKKSAQHRILKTGEHHGSHPHANQRIARRKPPPRMRRRWTRPRLRAHRGDCRNAQPVRRFPHFRFLQQQG